MTSNLSRRSILAAAPLGILAACSNSGSQKGSTSSSTINSQSSSNSSNPSAASQAAEPTNQDATSSPGGPQIGKLTIASIGLDHVIISGGLASTGLLAPAPGTVQWYNASPRIGQPGNAVVVGHSTYNGPDVFAKLPKVKKGDSITFTGTDGKTQKFTVTRTEDVNKDKLRNRQDVWGSGTKPVLVLVTCDPTSGWEPGGKHHVNNSVVWATPTN